MPFVFTTLTLMGAKVGEATHVENNQVKELVEGTKSSSKGLSEFVPTDQNKAAHEALVEEWNHPPFYYGPKETQGTSREGTSQAVKETHQGEQDKGMGHRTSSKEQMERMQTVMEELKANPNPNPELRERARKLLAEVKGKESREQARRKLQSSCFQWGIPNEVTAIGISDGDGTAIKVTYNLNTINTCENTISNVAFQATETIACLAGCAEALITRELEISGLPSSIAQGQTSTGTRYDTIACIRTDANGAQTPTVPTSMSTVVYPTGTQGSSSFLQGMPESFKVYP